MVNLEVQINMNPEVPIGIMKERILENDDIPGALNYVFNEGVNFYRKVVGNQIHTQIGSKSCEVHEKEKEKLSDSLYLASNFYKNYAEIMGIFISDPFEKLSNDTFPFNVIAEIKQTTYLAIIKKRKEIEEILSDFFTNEIQGKIRADIYLEQFKPIVFKVKAIGKKEQNDRSFEFDKKYVESLNEMDWLEYMKSLADPSLRQFYKNNSSKDEAALKIFDAIGMLKQTEKLMDYFRGFNEAYHITIIQGNNFYQDWMNEAISNFNIFNKICNNRSELYSMHKNYLCQNIIENSRRLDKQRITVPNYGSDRFNEANRIYEKEGKNLGCKKPLTSEEYLEKILYDCFPTLEYYDLTIYPENNDNNITSIRVLIK
ncbi:MAG: hypothetical protein ACOYT4_00390 [Nanoarchaeota archaeon]